MEIEDIDRNEFFMQITKRICGSLDIETALWSCFKYLEGVMPVTGMNLHLFEQNLSEMRSIAQVTRYEIEKLDHIISLPEEAKARLDRDWPKLRDVMIVNRPELNPFAQAITRFAGKPNTSIMVIRLEIEGERLGSLAMYVDGKDKYTREHARLLSLLHDPFAIAMSNALKHQEVLKFKDMLADDNRYLHRELLRLSGDEIVGKSSGLRDVMGMVRQVAPLANPVLLLGETGVGKEVIANAIHYSSPRKGGPFIKVNCGAIPDTLLDSELFGHEKGAFTGAITKKRGRFERAHKGTILLDEIGELPPQAQVRLLRVLQEKEIERVGGTKPINIDIRIIASTHRDLEEMVGARQFREDLWFRLNVFPIKIPPLRNRKEDIPALVNHFVRRKSSKEDFQVPPEIDPEAVAGLVDYHWPGNVRELENVVERSLIQYQGRDDSVPLRFEGVALPLRKENSVSEMGAKAEFLKLDEAVSLHIHRALEMTGGKIYGSDGAAELLGINPSTLRSRMKKLRITFPSKRQG
jgi:transcriptional regulator with GAF, ATPase, and Fis domain